MLRVPMDFSWRFFKLKLESGPFFLADFHLFVPHDQSDRQCPSGFFFTAHSSNVIKLSETSVVG